MTIKQRDAAYTKIAELEQAATTLRQLEELLLVGDVHLIPIEGGSVKVLHWKQKTNVGVIRGISRDRYLPAAIAAAWEGKEE